MTVTAKQLTKMSLNIEHIYLALHTRLSVLFARVLPKPVRAIVEGLLLLVGLFLYV